MFAQDFQVLTSSPRSLFAENMQKKKIMDSAKKRMEICGSKSVQKNQSSFMKTAF